MNGPPEKDGAALAGTALENQAASQSDKHTSSEVDNFIQLGDAAYAALAAASIGLTEVEQEYCQSLPVVCDGRVYNTLVDLGIPSSAINGEGRFGALNFDRVVFLEDGRFEFSRYSGWADSVPAVVIPLFDELNNLVNLVAWSAKTRRVALWRGWEAGLGFENLYRARLGEPLVVHDNILGWLRAERRGLFILNDPLAAERLRGVTLGVSHAQFGRDLREKLTLPPPAIVVSQFTESMVTA